MIAGFLLAITVFLGGLSHIQTTAPVVTLTVDATVPGPKTVELARSLRRQGIPATFFFSTRALPGQFQGIRQVHEAGHAVGLLVERPLPASPVRAICRIRRERDTLARAARSSVLYLRTTIPLSPVIADACRNEGLVQVGFSSSRSLSAGQIVRLAGGGVDRLLERVRHQHLRWVSLEEFLQDGVSHRAFCLGGGDS